MKIDEDIKDALVEIVRASAKAHILPNFRHLEQGDIEAKTDASDLVTIADKASETFITAKVMELLPNAVVIGEEAVSQDEHVLEALSSAELAVIIDPIDGTWNYAHGLPLFGIILSVVQNGQTVLGIHYDPITDAWIWAIIGQGAYFDNSQGQSRQLNVRQDSEQEVGFVPLFLFDKPTQKRLAPLMTDFDRVLSFRCSCHEYWLMAEGHVDFLLSGALKPWDHAAGELIYHEAGGYAAMLETGEAYSPKMRTGQLLLARNKAHWEKLRDQFINAFERALGRPPPLPYTKL